MYEKEIKRRPPCPDYDIRGTEKWLEQMAARGYHLCEGHAFQGGWAYFLEGEPKSVRFRLDAAKKISQGLYGHFHDAQPPEEEILQINGEFGWKYITYRGHFHIYACEDPAAPELNTDPQIQAIALKIVTKRQRSQLFYLLFYGLLMCGPSGSLFCQTLVDYPLNVFLPTLLFSALAIAAWLPGFLYISRFRKVLSLGSFPESPAHFSEFRATWMHYQPSLLLLCLMICVFLRPYDPGHTGPVLDDAAQAGFPFPTAASLFPDGEMVQPYSTWNLEWSTQAAPENYTLTEQFEVILPDGTKTTGRWEVEWHRTSFDWIAEGWGAETKFTDWLQLSNKAEGLDIALDGADWFAAYSIGLDTVYRKPHDVVIVAKDGVVIKAGLQIFNPDFPNPYSAEELARLLLNCIP